MNSRRLLQTTNLRRLYVKLNSERITKSYNPECELCGSVGRIVYAIHHSDCVGVLESANRKPAYDSLFSTNSMLKTVC